MSPRIDPWKANVGATIKPAKEGRKKKEAKVARLTSFNATALLP